MELNRITIGYLASLGVMVNTTENGQVEITRINYPDSFAFEYGLSQVPKTLGSDVHARDNFRAIGLITDSDVEAGTISAGMQSIILKDCATITKAINANPKKFHTMRNVGKARYLINYTEGDKFHPDGSVYYDLAIFSNKKAYDSYVQILLGDGFIQTN